MKTKHTPGPWLLEEKNCGLEWELSSGNKLIAIIEYEADARLFFAAPEMKIALGLLLNELPEHSEKSALMQAIKAARAAIAKAEGKE